MTIWILVVVLLLSLAGLGYRQGAIRVAFSLVGIFVAAMLALPLAPLVKPILPILGVKSLLWLWLLPPFIVFVLINSAFKAAALPVHKKADVYYKYKAGDLRQRLFERLNARLGFCLGLLNGTVYLVLILLPIYMLGYWTVPLATSEEDPWTVRLFNRFARDLQDTGLTRVAKAIDPLPDWYYDTADLVGLIHYNPMADALLVRYPAFFALGARPELQQLGQDDSFKKLRMERRPIREVIDSPQVQGILNNPEMLGFLWAKVQPDMEDLKGFLLTGKSVKYGNEPFLGTWSFDFTPAFAEYRRANPKLTALQLREMRKFLSGLFLNTTMTVGTDGYLTLKGLPRVKAPQASEVKNLAGKWTRSGGSYDLQFEDGGARMDLGAKVDGDRLTVTGFGPPLDKLFFDRDI